ncbi:FMN-dependent NADH-azoreductase [Diplonema papillatum]|nr:FMN-dependent NADH-azoreductase [Diplonema papillatum]
MPALLVLKSSLNGANSKSNALVNDFVKQWQAKNSSGSVTTRDLGADALPHLTAAEMGSWMTEPEKRTAEQKKAVKLSDDLIKELKAASTVVVGMPMYNFMVPSTFKTWLDRVVRAGQTFKYTATGPAPLLDPKKVYILCSRGGLYAGTPNDVQTPYLKAILGLVGQTDLTFVYAEGMSTGGAEQALADAKAKVAKLF